MTFLFHFQRVAKTLVQQIVEFIKDFDGQGDCPLLIKKYVEQWHSRIKDLRFYHIDEDYLSPKILFRF